MAVSNKEQVGRALDVLAEALEPFVDRVLGPLLPTGQPWTVLLELKDEARGRPRADRYNPMDLHLQLRAINERHGELGFPFDGPLSRGERNLAGELADVRNRVAHNESFSPDDAYRALDTVERLLRAIGSIPQADEVRRRRLDIQRGAYESETRRAGRAPATPDTADTDLPAWREVLPPHTDVQNGTFASSEFAADLYRVAVEPTGTDDEYADPIEFFRRTYLTEGLKDLLLRAAARVSGDANAQPVINLQTTFGGGKTHSMLAVWHLFSGRPLGAFPQEVQDLLREGDPTGLTVRRVAIVGNEISPGQPDTKPDATVVHTLWGELAWQLGGAEAYALVAQADQTRTNPGATLRTLLADHGPAVILIDEWVAYARQLHSRSDLAAGDFETQFTFAQALTQAVAAVPGVLLLVSVPASDVRRDTADAAPGEIVVDASDLEVGGRHGREALQRLDNVIRRVAHQWAPASRDESYEIVRRRLFREPDNAASAAINATARRFIEYYRQHRAEFPSGVTESDYERRIRAAYPIHPELLDRLYTDWSTLERFQRTRGVLRLMSTVVHELWARGDRSPLIVPGSVPLDEAGARSEIVQYVDPRWTEIVETDIDGRDAISRRVDSDRPLLGKRSTALRVARTVFLDSAPTLDAVRKGVDRKRVTLGVAMPGDVVGNFGSALDGLVNTSSHLFRDGDRYWYDTQPSLNRLAAERAKDLPAERVHGEVVTRLRQLLKAPAPDFAGVIAAPETSGDVADEEGTRLVVLRPEHRHNGKDKESAGARFVLNLLQHRGTGPRLRPNSIVALAADENRWKDLEDTTRTHLAWRSIVDDTDLLDLTQQRAAQARKRADESNRTIEDQIPATWIWALHAVQDDPSSPLTVGQIKCDGAEKRLAVRTGAKLVREGVLHTHLAPAALHIDLVGVLRARWNRGHVSVGDLWDYFTRHPYLVRLRDRSVLTETVRDVLTDAGWTQQGFALATGYDETTGRYDGLAVPLEDQHFGQITDTTLLVRPEIATEQRQQEREEEREAERQRLDVETKRRGGSTDRTPDPVDRVSEEEGADEEEPPRTIRAGAYTGRFLLEDRTEDIPSRLAEVAREVLQLLADTPDLDLFEISVDVRAETSDGFPEGTRRAVQENARTLRFDTSRFDDVEY
ncbi:ATPase AAA [Actinotalea ferrariae CF5-4]|uniref:ATPase AAA n=1 Tax=Actinotalea ferrariae CF5-4 TaxID=948458 RepID=A0A021VVC5_9CELL|nr:Swt1 family HEPN domain-containing protein [Actinotalea ferrariae]EYR63017.1 ATPase AAA [Actinotalea ferrariae CF5-4]